MMAMGPEPAKVLSGIRIVDLTQIGAGPYATSLLGDFGADVIKVEPPDGDQLRYVDELYGYANSAYFYGLNRSKRGVVLDLKKEKAQRVLTELVRGADVFIVSMRPEAARALRIDYETLAELNPALVYCSITAFGEDGPLASQPGMDLLAQARGGIMGITGEPGGPPIKVGPPIADWTVSYLACWGIVMALYARLQSGVGQKVSANLLDGMVAMMPNFTAPYFKSGKPVRPQGGGHPQLVPYEIFATSDGYLVVACLTEKFWTRLCGVIGDEYAQDERFRTNPLRLANREALERKLTAVFLGKTKAEWSELLRVAGVPFSPVNTFEEIFEDEQVVHNKMLLELEDPVHGTIKTVNNPLTLSATPAQPSRYPPQLGEHTDEVLRELGVTNEAIEELRRDGAI